MHFLSLTASPLRLVLLISFLLLCLTGSVFAYFHFTSERITIQNESNYYTVRYTPTKKFTKMIDEWGVWEEKNNFYNEDQSVIKKIEIIFTDEVQDHLIVKNEDTNVWTGGKSLADEDTVVIKIQINPEIFGEEIFEDNKDRNIDRLVLSSVLDMLYDLTREFRGSSVEEVQEFTHLFKQEEYPFYVQLKE